MRNVPGRDSCRCDGEEMTVAKRTRQIFGETKRQANEARKVKNEINNYANLTTSTLSEMTRISALIVHNQYNLAAIIFGQLR
jgi:hypothetical protein